MRRRAPHRIDPMGGLRAAHFFLVLEPADSPRVAGAPGRPSTEPRAPVSAQKARSLPTSGLASKGETLVLSEAV